MPRYNENAIPVWWKMIRFLNASDGSEISVWSSNISSTSWTWIARWKVSEVFEVMIPVPVVPPITNTLTRSQATATLTSTVSWVAASTVISDASPTNRGMVSTGTQSFAGNKTFTNDLSVNWNVILWDASSDRITCLWQFIWATPLVFQWLTDNAFTHWFVINDPTQNTNSVFRNVSWDVAHVYHDWAKAVVVGTNTVNHNLNLSNPSAFVVQAFNTADNEQMILNVSSVTANSFKFTSTIPATIRVTCIG